MRHKNYEVSVRIVSVHLLHCKGKKEQWCVCSPVAHFGRLSLVLVFV